METRELACFADTCETDEIENIAEIRELIRELRLFDWGQKDITILVGSLIERFCDNVKVDWMRYCQTGPDGVNYKRILLCEDKEFTLQLLCFQPKMGNLIHDHGEAKCCFKVLHGTILEQKYKKPCQAGETKWKATQIYEEGDINESSTSLHLHCCRNLSPDAPAVTLVLYYPAISQVNVYDEMTGEDRLADLTFDAPDHAVRPSRSGGIAGVVIDVQDRQ